jgi:hypothetical protein
MYSNIIKVAETREASPAQEPWDKVCTEQQPSYNSKPGYPSVPTIIDQQLFSESFSCYLT